MSQKITQLFKDKLKTIKQYPITLIKAIYDDKGNRLDNILGNTDISSIGDGTITGGIKSVSDEVNKNASDITELNNNLDTIFHNVKVVTGLYDFSATVGRNDGCSYGAINVSNLSLLTDAPEGFSGQAFIIDFVVASNLVLRVLYDRMTEKLYVRHMWYIAWGDWHCVNLL